MNPLPNSAPPKKSAKRKLFDDGPAAERLCLESPESKLLQVALTTFMGVNNNFLWIHPENCGELFNERFNRELPGEHFLQMGEFIYPVKTTKAVAPAFIAMHPALTCESAMMKIAHAVEVSPVYKKNCSVRICTRILFEIDYQACKAEKPFFLEASKVRQLLRNQLFDCPVKPHQTYFFSYPDLGLFKVLVKNSDIGSGSASPPTSLNFLGTSTRLDFQPRRNSSICLIEPITPSKPPRGHFNVSLEDRSDRLCEWPTQDDEQAQQSHSFVRAVNKRGCPPLSYVVDLDSLATRMLKQFNDTLLAPGMGLSLTAQQRQDPSLYLELESLELHESLHAACHSSNGPAPYAYAKGIYLIENVEMLFKTKLPELLLVRGAIQKAKSIKLTVQEVIGFQKREIFGSPRKQWISTEEISKALQRMSGGVVDKQVLALQLPNGPCIVQIKKGKALSKQSPHSCRWAVDDTTKILLDSYDAAEVGIIPSLTPRTISLLILSITCKKYAENKLPQPSLAELKTAFELHRQTIFSQPFVIGQSLYWEYSGYLWKIETHSALPVGKRLADKSPWLGVVKKETGLKIRNVKLSKNLLLQGGLTSIKAIDDALNQISLGGLTLPIKEAIRTILIGHSPLTEQLQRPSMRPPKGLLMYGPPGTGKTALARELAQLLGCPKERIKWLAGSEILNMWLGESERKVRELFQPAQDASKKGGKNELYLIFIDEIDSILGSREEKSGNSARNSIVNQILSLLDGLIKSNNVLLVGTTNRKDMLDPAALRPGRFDLQVEFSLPDTAGREEIFEVHMRPLKELNIVDTNIRLHTLAEKSEGLSGAQIEAVVIEASNYSVVRLAALNLPAEEITTHPTGMITQEDFEQAISKLFPKTKTEPPSYVS